MLLRGERHGLLVIDRALFVELKAKRFRAVMSGWIQHREGGIDQPQKIAEITKKLELAFSLRSLCSFVAKSFGCGCAALRSFAAMIPRPFASQFVRFTGKSRS